MAAKSKIISLFTGGRSFLRKAKFAAFRPDFTIGKRYTVGRGIFISRKNKITIGDDFYMGNYCHLASNAEIGNDVMFASYVSLVGGDHDITNPDILLRQSGRGTFKTTIIEDNVWLGHGVVVMHGVRIGSGAVIAAGAVITKDVPENEIWGGNPSRLLKVRRKSK